MQAKNMMSRRDFLRLSAVGTAGVLAAACVAPTAVQGPADSAMEEPMEVEYLHKGNWQNILKGSIDDFEARTGVTIKLTQASAAGARLDLLSRLAAGNPPDIHQDLGNKIFGEIARGVFLPLDDTIAASDWDLDDIIQSDVEGGSWNGKFYFAPVFHNSTYGQFLTYWKPYFDEARMPYPPEGKWHENYSDFYAELTNLNQTDASGNTVRWGYDNFVHWSAARLLGGILDQGGHWWDDQKKEFTLTTDETVQAIKTIHFDAVFEYGCSPADGNRPEGAGWQTFDQGYATSAAEPALQHAGGAGRPEAIPLMGYTEMPGLVEGKHNMVYYETQSIGAVAAAPKGNHEMAKEFCINQFRPEPQIYAWKTFAHVSGLKEFVNNPIAVADAESAGNFGISFADYKRAVNDEHTWVGWEWGDLGLATYVMLRCSNRFITIPDEIAASFCERSGTMLSGNITPEQLAEEWQEVATTYRRQYFRNIGIDPDAA